MREEATKIRDYCTCFPVTPTIVMIFSAILKELNCLWIDCLLKYTLNRRNEMNKPLPGVQSSRIIYRTDESSKASLGGHAHVMKLLRNEATS